MSRSNLVRFASAQSFVGLLGRIEIGGKEKGPGTGMWDEQLYFTDKLEQMGFSCGIWYAK